MPSDGAIGGLEGEKRRADDLGPPWSAELLTVGWDRVRSRDRTQVIVVRGSILDQTFLFVGGYANKGRKDVAAHVATLFWKVSNSTGYSQLSPGSIPLDVVRTQQFEAKIQGPTNCHCRYIVGNRGDNVFVRRCG